MTRWSCRSARGQAGLDRRARVSRSSQTHAGLAVWVFTSVHKRDGGKGNEGKRGMRPDI